MKKSILVALVASLLFISAKTFGFETHISNADTFISLRNTIQGGNYNNLRTHPWLTLQSIEHSNNKNEIVENNVYRSQVMLGSIAEDFDFRYAIVAGDPVNTHPAYVELSETDTFTIWDGVLSTTGENIKNFTRGQNHFYSGGYTSSNPAAGRLTDTFGTTLVFTWYPDRESAVHWALNSTINSMSLNNNNIASANKEQKLLMLGHALHLLEDMAVPEHVRNDTHAWSKGGPSPYEKTIADHSWNEHGTWPTLLASNIQPQSYDYLANYFEELSRFARTHFFSQNTIFRGFRLDSGMKMSFHVPDGEEYYVTGVIDGNPVRLAKYTATWVLP